MPRVCVSAPPPRCSVPRGILSPEPASPAPAPCDVTSHLIIMQACVRRHEDRVAWRPPPAGPGLSSVTPRAHFVVRRAGPGSVRRSRRGGASLRGHYPRSRRLATHAWGRPHPRLPSERPPTSRPSPGRNTWQVSRPRYGAVSAPLTAAACGLPAPPPRPSPTTTPAVHFGGGVGWRGPFD